LLFPHYIDCLREETKDAILTCTVELLIHDKTKQEKMTVYVTIKISPKFALRILRIRRLVVVVVAMFIMYINLVCEI